MDDILHESTALYSFGFLSYTLNKDIVQLGPASVFSPNLGPKQNTKIHFNTHPPTTNFLEGSRHSRESRFGM